ncbi:unnamed protein product [Toxocara canis]|uniref:Helicase ATP-binding domain-containing protein n=1 Tax=Toxocara canis TaxID=6265 RepID=A0A183VGR9_TOXCA|nr:unnamed protein product [Toxocara canis]
MMLYRCFDKPELLHVVINLGVAVSPIDMIEEREVITTHMATPNFWKQFQNRKRKSISLNGIGSSELASKNGTPRHRFIKPEPVLYTELLVGGFSVKLPPNMVPYTTQRTMMAKILTSLKNKLNALIESPTGSGKTLGLLSATCAWLVRYKEDRERSKAECRACNGHASVSLESVPPGHENTVGSWLASSSDSLKLSAKTSTDLPLINKPLLTCRYLVLPLSPSPPPPPNPRNPSTLRLYYSRNTKD